MARRRALGAYRRSIVHAPPISLATQQGPTAGLVPPFQERASCAMLSTVAAAPFAATALSLL